MGLRAEIQADLAQAFDTDLADAIQPFTGSRTITGTYDPVTDTTMGDAGLIYSGRGDLRGSYTIREVEALGVLATDKKAIVLQNELTETPAIDDMWLSEDGSFRVVFIEQDDVAASYTVQLRRV